MKLLLLMLCSLPCFSLVVPLMAKAQSAPQRIVSLGPINTENIYLLGAEDRLVGNTRYCVRPAAAVEKEKIGSVMLVDIEKIISLHPDLVLATPLTRPGQVQQLKKLGFQVVQIKQPDSFLEICAQFIRLGNLLGLEERAKLIVQQTWDEVEAVKKKVGPLPKQQVFLQVGAQKLFASVKSSFTHDYIVLGGGINIVEDQKHGATSYEKVIAKNPDIIIIAIMGSETGIAAQEKKNWQRFYSIKAVQEDRVHMLDPDLVCSPSPATFAQTLRVIAGLIHPEIVMEEDE